MAEGCWVSRSFRVATVFLLLLGALSLAGCLPDAAEKIDFKQGEKPVEAAERFVNARLALADRIITDAERYVAALAAKEGIPPGIWANLNRAVALEEKVPMLKAIDELEESPAGAYVTQQDKDYVRRLYTQHGKGLKVRAEALEGRYRDTVGDTGDRVREIVEHFYSMPESKTRLLKIDGVRWRAFFAEFWKASSEAGTVEERDSYFRPKRDFLSKYHSMDSESRGKFLDIVSTTVNRTLAERSNGFSRFNVGVVNFFLESEVAYGVFGSNNGWLQRLGFYDYLSEKDRDEIDRRMRVAIGEVARSIRGGS